MSLSRGHELHPEKNLADLRVSYERGHLDLPHGDADPFALFKAWLDEALAEESIVEPYAMSVATVDASARPSSRMVLLRGYDADGFVFFTNYESRKGTEIAGNSSAAMLFWWGALQRQIRIEGAIEKLSEGDSDAYFAKRPRGHRLSAWASHQSTVVPDRAALESEMAAVNLRFPGDDVPRPAIWGGYRLVPTYFEFWQGRRSRVHDRLAFTRERTAWTIARLAP
jgi:pyridoxamine 5'-phosphate oxidase